MKGLHRIHLHLSHLLTLNLRGKHDQASAYCVQLLKAIYQVAMDDGSWTDAALLLNAKDPLTKEEFGANESELEIIAANREALQRLWQARKDVKGNKEERV